MRDDKRRTAVARQNQHVSVNGLLDAIAGMVVDINEIKPFLAVGAFPLFMPNRIVRLCLMVGERAAARGLVLTTPDPGDDQKD